jgi:hypothetical protein
MLVSISLSVVVPPLRRASHLEVRHVRFRGNHSNLKITRPPVDDGLSWSAGLLQLLILRGVDFPLPSRQYALGRDVW